MKVLIFFALAFATVWAKDIYFRSIKNPALDNEGRIFKGQNADPGQFRYQVGINNKRKDIFYWCSGSLIAKDWVLTAAVCIEGSNENLQRSNATLNSSSTSQQQLPISSLSYNRQQEECIPDLILYDQQQQQHELTSLSFSRSNLQCRQQKLEKLKLRETQLLALAGGDVARGYCSCDEQWTTTSSSPPTTSSPTSDSTTNNEVCIMENLQEHVDETVYGISYSHGHNKRKIFNNKNNNKMVVNKQLTTLKQLSTSAATTTAPTTRSTTDIVFGQQKQRTPRLKQQHHVRFSDEKNFSD